MNLQHYLLSRIAEEASEVIKAALKAQNFGMDSVNPHTGIANREELRLELIDLQAVKELLEDLPTYSHRPHQGELSLKKRRVAEHAIAVVVRHNLKLTPTEEAWLSGHLNYESLPRPEKSKSLNDIPLTPGGVQRTDQ